MKNSNHTTRIFISYKTGVDDGLTYTANSLRRELKNKGYTVWMDESDLKAGENWNDQIYDSIAYSDILIMLLGNTTVNSDWVRREIDIARGAKICILPVLIRENFPKQEAMDKFDLPRMQYIDLTKGADHQFDQLVKDIEGIEGKTLANQLDWLKSREKVSKGTEVKPHVQKWASYQLKYEVETKSDETETPNEPIPDIPDEIENTENKKVDTQISQPKTKWIFKGCTVHIAAGDMTKMKDIDVLVNSENAYFQMARIFESKTVSALLRYYGSYIDDCGHLAEDTIQDELNKYIKDNCNSLPLGIGTVIITSAGHKESILRTRRNARYIFHTAAVSVEGDGIERSLSAIKSNSGIRQCVINTLEKVDKVTPANSTTTTDLSAQATSHDQLQSVSTAITPDNTNIALSALNPPSENTIEKPITSIILPLFASGHGGRKANEVMAPIADGVKDFLDGIRKGDHKTTLKHIYISVFHEEDLAEMRKALQAEFKEIMPPPNERK